MNDLLLTGQLRALRQPPPDNGFEARLQLALVSEAQALRAPNVVVPFRSARRLQRWGARIGLGTALALGASAAAAAAGGIWAFVASQAEPVVSPSAAPVLEQGGTRRAQRTAPVVSSPEPTPPEQPVLAEPEAAPLPELSPPTVTPAGGVEHKAIRAAAPGRAERLPARQTRPQPEGLVPFELPRPAGAVSAVPGASAARPSTPAAGRGTPASAAERRALPQLPARAEQQPGRPERAERDKKEKDKKEPPGREIARERSLDKADRGLERAKEARERNNNKK